MIFIAEQMKTYLAAGVPWSNIAIGSVGSTTPPQNKALYDALHAEGVMVMVATAPPYDKLPAAAERSVAYRKVIEDGADIIESDRPIEVPNAIKQLYPATIKRYRFWDMAELQP